MIERIRAVGDHATANTLAEALVSSNIGSEMMGEAKSRIDKAVMSHVARNPEIGEDLKAIQAYLSTTLKKLFR